MKVMKAMLKKMIEHKSVTVAVAGVLIGLLLIGFGALKGGKETTEPVSDTVSYTSEELETYTSALEKKVAEHLERIGGVSGVSVILTIEASNEKVYATEGTSKDFVILTDSKGAEMPLSVMEINARVRGIAVVCDYSSNEAIRSEMIDMLSSLFGIGANRISVMQS